EKARRDLLRDAVGQQLLDDPLRDLVANEVADDDVDELAAQRASDRAFGEIALEHPLNGLVRIRRLEGRVDERQARLTDALGDALLQVTLRAPGDLDGGDRRAHDKDAGSQAGGGRPPRGPPDRRPDHRPSLPLRSRGSWPSEPRTPRRSARPAGAGRRAA